MGVLLARSECRGGFWHVVTYDISNPDNWQEIGDIATQQECSVSLQIAFQETAPAEGYDDDDRRFVALHRELIEQPDSAVLISPAGHAVSLTHDGGSTVLQHCDEVGETVQTTCSGRCGSGENAVKLGPLDCPSRSPVLDCTAKPPTLTCR